MVHGFSLAYRCPLCCSATETINHLFFNCGFSMNIWNWLRDMLDLSTFPSSVVDWLHLCDNISSPQAMTVFGAYVINTLAEIWHAHNDMKHEIN